MHSFWVGASDDWNVNIAAYDFGAKKYLRCTQVLVLAELFLSGTQCTIKCFQGHIYPRRSKFLPSANEVAERLNLHLSVILFHGGGGGCLPQCMLRSTPGQTPSPPQTVTAADGTHPTGIHSCFFFFLYVQTTGRKLVQTRINSSSHESLPLV